jgi:hypothetical protein
MLHIREFLLANNYDKIIGYYFCYTIYSDAMLSFFRKRVDINKEFAKAAISLRNTIIQLALTPPASKQRSKKFIEII